MLLRQLENGHRPDAGGGRWQMAALEQRAVLAFSLGARSESGCSLSALEKRTSVPMGRQYDEDLLRLKGSRKSRRTKVFCDRVNPRIRCLRRASDVVMNLGAKSVHQHLAVSVSKRYGY